ncbi:hypothetical protein [Arthrobacter pityocampae]|uniref:hypothetical protein n=1 Tax=Arthrobacter pityocampae TaxID=547334 RepID=UPI003736810E
MRFLPPAAGLCIIAAALAGCGQGAPAPTETLLTMPARPSPPDATGASPDGLAGARQEAAAPETSDHCVVVAGGMTTAMLAPLTLLAGSEPGELQALEQQILDLRDKVPEDLRDDFTTLALSVEAPPRGSGTFDEEAFRHAMIPVQDWLGQHCTES